MLPAPQAWRMVLSTRFVCVARCQALDSLAMFFAISSASSRDGYRVICTDQDAMNWAAEDLGNLRVALNALVRLFRL